MSEAEPKRIRTAKMAVDKLKTADDRKARKPLLERKRRARINDSLTELKGIVLRSLNKDCSRYTKMEKADILEMAVKHLKVLRQAVNGYSTADSASCYRDGYTQCASEVSRYVMTMDSIDHSTRTNILAHINTSCQSIQVPIPYGSSSPPLSPLVPTCVASDPQDRPYYHFHPIAHPLPPFLGQVPHMRHERRGNDVTFLHQTPGYPPSTAPYSSSSSTPPREASTSTKETPRPTEPVWRPW